MLHKSDIFFYLLVAFMAGVFLGSVQPITGRVLMIAAISGLVVISLSFQNKPGLLIGFLVLAFIAGAARFNGSNEKVSLISSAAGREVVLRGYIGREPEIREFQRFVLRTADEQILVTTGPFPAYRFGDSVIAKGVLELPKNPTSETASGSSDFDYAAYLKKDGISATLFFPELKVSDEAINTGFLGRAELALYQNIFKIKTKFQSAINISIPEPNAAFINGILLGMKHGIPDSLDEAFRKTGTSHVLAISGYNIMIISWAVLGGLIWFFRRRTAFWISVAVIILFVILTGASASVVRAAVMGLILSFAHGYGRLYDQKNSIILAGAIMTFHNPMVLVFDVGFQLSFAAVLGLTYLYPLAGSKLYRLPKLGGLKEIFLVTLSAQIAVFPLLLYYFGYFSPISLLANVLILPVIPAAMLAGFIAGSAGMILSPLGQIAGWFAWAITAYQIWVIDILSLL